MTNSGKNLTYHPQAKNVTEVTFGALTWGTGRSGTGYAFSSGTAINAEDMTFTGAPTGDPMGQSMTLLTDATGVTDGSITPPTAGTVNAGFTDAKGVAYTGTATGTVSVGTGTDADKVFYTIDSGTLSNIDLAGWNGTESAVPTGWTGAGVAVAGSFTKPSLEPGQSQGILTATTAGIFSDAKIDEAIRYKSSGSFTDDLNGVTISGNRAGGVKTEANGTTANARLVYYAEKYDVDTVSPGTMAWGTPGAATSAYDFSGVTAIDATNLSFTFADASTLSATSSTTLLSDATGLAADLPVTYKDSAANHTQEVAYSTANGAALTGTLTGAVSTTAGAVNYEASSMTLDSVTVNGVGDTADTVPSGWTKNASGVSVDTDSMTAPTLEAGTSKEILTGTAVYFSDEKIDGQNKYQSYDLKDDVQDGVAFTGSQKKGVRADGGGTKLVYATDKKNVTAVSLGDVTLGKGRTATADYDFATVTKVDIGDLAFTNPESVSGTMTLLADAANLPAGDEQTHTQSLKDYKLDNGVTLDVTLTGTVKHAAKALTYTAAATAVDSADLSGWDGAKASAVPSGWTKNSGGVTVTGDGFTASTLDLGASTAILTTEKDGFFSDARIDSSIAEQTAAYSDTEKNITLTGEKVQGVKASADGKNLLYGVGKANLGTVALSAVTYEKGATLLDRSAEVYDFTNVKDLDTTGFALTMTEAQTKEAKKNDTMTLVKGNGTLADIAGKEAGSAGAYTYTPTDGLTVNAALTGSVSATGGSVLYTIDGNEASNLTFSNAAWGTQYAHTEAVGYTGALVDTENIAFTGVDTLSRGTTMTLVENFGDGIKRVKGSVFALANGKTGKGHAYWDSATESLMFVVDRGIDEIVEKKDAIGQKEVVPEGEERKGTVNGGKAEGEGEAEGNQVEVRGTVVTNDDGTGGDVNGGKSEDGDANENKTTVEDSEVGGDVNGGKSDGDGDTEGNETTVSGSEIGGDVNGGHSGGNGDTKDNKTTVTGSKIGGYGEATAADDNTVFLGGGSVMGNTVTSPILGVTIDGGVYGGYSVSGTTRNNDVNLYGDADISMANLFGGNLEATGNVLNLGLTVDNTPKPWTGGGQEVKNIANFENINFTVVPWDETKAAVTINDGEASDLSKATVGAEDVTFTGVKSLAVNDTMTFLDQSKTDKKATSVTENSDFTLGMSVEGTGTVSLDDKQNVVYKVKSVRASEQTHNTLMGAEAAMTLLSVGNDFIGAATEGLGLLENMGYDGVSTFAKLGGGKLRQETGSHVDVNTWNAIIALGKKNRGEKSAFEYGAFFEYGNGNYTTHNDAGQRGDGSARYTGGGLLAKWTANQGFYVEGSLRAGNVHDDTRNLLRDAVQAYSYDTNECYFGFHLGVGKEIELKDGDAVDVYGKYFFNRRNGSDFTVNGDDYSLDSVKSSVLRVGARYTMKREKWNFYGGLAYEHELDGKAGGRVNGISIRSADIGGGSARLELGATMKSDAGSPWSLDLNMAGYAGKKKGVMGGVSVSFGF